MASDYHPPSLGSLSVGGLPPPASRSRWLGSSPAPCGGLQCDPFPVLKVDSGALALQMSLSTALPKASLPSRPMLSVQPLVASEPLQISGDVVAASDSISSTMLEVHQQLKQQHVLAWLQLLRDAGSHSELLQATVGSDTPELHQARVVARFAPSTLAAYLRTWQTWMEFCICHQACPYQPSMTLVADFLQVSSRKSALGVATAQSRSLVWVAKHAGFPCLRQALESPLVRSYVIPSTMTLRKEAAPLPLSFVVYLEQAILKESGSSADRLLMGCLLVLIWSSLRWSDALWISPIQLAEDDDLVRGVATCTKTTSRGMPFAFIKCGLLSGTTSSNWAMKWLNLVRAAWQRTSERFPTFQPDFLIPQCGPSVEHPMFVAPLQRAQGVLVLRRFLLQSSSDASTTSVGVHSPKVTLLSWARQIGVSEEARMAQGHHRLSGARQTAAPYGRDDVHPAIFLQKQIVHRISRGFRPVIPMMRGGGQPVMDKPLAIPLATVLPKESDEVAVCLPDANDLVDTDSDPSSEDEADESTSAAPPPVLQAPMADCIFLLNESSNVAHVAACCLPDDLACVVTVQSSRTSRSYKFACNVRPSASHMVISSADTFPSHYRLCMRSACARVFD